MKGTSRMRRFFSSLEKDDLETQTQTGNGATGYAHAGCELATLIRESDSGSVRVMER